MADWLGRLSAFLPGADQMSEQERMALIRQGLLAFGSGTLANNGNNYGKAGPAIGAGLSQGLLAMNKGADQLAENKYKKQYMESQGGDPTQFRAMDMMAKAAGYEPGTDGYKEFFKRANGEIARQSSAAIQYRVEKGEDGVPRLIAVDPRQVGAQVVGGEGSAGSYTIDPSLPPEVQAAIRASEQSGRPLPPNIDLAPVLPRRSSGVNPFRGRRAEDEAAAVAAAQKGVELGALPTELGMRTNAAIQAASGTTAASETAKTQAEAQRNLPQAQQSAQMMLDTITKLETHPGLSTILGVSGKIDPRNYIPGTDAKGAQALADQIHGQVFMQAYQSLKGGGQITEVEGAKAEDAMARLNQAQSENDYKAALRDLREVISSTYQRIRQQAVGASAGPAHDPLGIF